MSSGSHCTTKVKVHKPIPVVLKPSDTISFPHYTPQPPRPSTSPLLSSLNSTPSPLRAQHTPSPLSGRHTPSPQSIRNSTPPQNSKNESPFNISLCDQSSARAAAEKEVRTRNHENHRTNHNSQTTPVTSSRKTIISETPDKSKANSRPSIVSSPSVSSTPTQLFPSKKNPVSENSRTIESENPCGENPIRNFSPESKTPSIAESGRNFEPDVKTQREKKTVATKTPTTGKVTHPSLVVDDAQSYGTGETSTAQKRVISPEGGHSSRMENTNTQNVNTNPMSTRSEQSRGAQYTNAQTCSHLHAIAQIQLEYLIFLEGLMRFQHKMIVEAISTINKTLTQEQFHYVADFFCNLVEGNKYTENILREAYFARQEKERVEHQRHMSQETVASLRSVFDRLPEEVKTRLRSAGEFVNNERDQVLNFVLSFGERQQQGKQMREWEVFKQQLQKQHQESFQKQQQQIEEKTLPARRSSESQKRSNGQQQHNEKTQNQSLSGYISLSSDSPNQVETSKEVKKTEQQRKQGRASEDTELTENRTQVPRQSPRQEESIVSQQQASRSEVLRTSQHLEQLHSLLLQRQHFYEQQHYEEVQKKMVDELFQVKDMDQKTILLQHIVQALQSQKASSREGLKSPPAISSGLGTKAAESQLTNVQNKQSQYAGPREVSY